ncbi:MAG: bifunctional hydroxymethylpyrimidine kinase/phosphomethylpyrimidine kinase [bacterium]|nr:bifunctional hydroxymethylpyrimidine kinase/phosphomethylpyrimidine kinase [bacterium]
MKTALTIAGSDSSGGAGIQADLKTMTANGVFGMSAVTSITAQNTTGVFGIYDVSPEALTAQLDAVFTDIFPDSVKVGMVSSVGLIKAIAEALVKYKPSNVVLDPVMVSTSGHSLLMPEAQNTLISMLFPLADIITPNVPEAEVLCGFKLKDESDLPMAAEFMAKKFNTAVLLKGGHLNGNDLLYIGGKAIWIYGKHIDNPNTHGTGCTLSSAIASQLAKGRSIEAAVIAAKEYIIGAISDRLNLGHGNGPINHMWNITERKE